MTDLNKKSTYHPPAELLEKYAQVLVNFALNSGKGLQPGEVVECNVPDVAKPFARALQNQVLKAGGHPIMRLLPTGFDQDYYSLAGEDQLKFFPEKYYQEKANLLHHTIQVLADPFPDELKEIDPEKIIMARDVRKPYKDWLVDKEQQGKFTWTIALWGVEAKAEAVGLSLEDYWQEIYQAVYLDEQDPIQKWREIHDLQKEIRRKLDEMQIEYVHMKGEDIDLRLRIGADRVWLGGSGRNIPSFEIFTSPDWHDVEGWFKSNEPVYRYGNIIKDTEFVFKNGVLVQAKASQGDRFLQQMIKSENADKLGEFSLTDKRMSRISHPMAETLFDENMGGPFGNSHIAIGMAFKECYRGDGCSLKKKDWEEKGFNDAAEHTDFVTTKDRTVTAELTDGSKVVIYKNGEFVI